METSEVVDLWLGVQFPVSAPPTIRATLRSGIATQSRCIGGASQVMELDTRQALDGATARGGS